MTYEESVAYLETFINHEHETRYHHKTAFRLERMRKFFSNLADPQRHLKIIHVAGTKGKGSTACFIAQILSEQGFRVGLYTSPHLKDSRERIRILDAKNTADEHLPFPGMILKNDFAALMDFLRPQIDFFRHSLQNFGVPTFFEILTALAVLHFRNKNADFAVLETGLGGRYDATNATDSLISVITPVSYDHERILGSTLAEIAFEKAGIIKGTNAKTPDGLRVSVSAPQAREAREVLRRRVKHGEGVLFEMGRDFHAKQLTRDIFSQEFFYRGLGNAHHFLKARMLGDHQRVNASVAVAACEALSLHGINITAGALQKGVLNAFWPGRLEVIHTKPFVILDGAHNRDSARRLAHFLGREFKSFRKWFVFGVCEDKDVGGIVEELEAVADRVILTRADNPRAADPGGNLGDYFRKKNPCVTRSVEEALDILKKEIAPDDVAVVTGSLFVVGEARSLWPG